MHGIWQWLNRQLLCIWKSLCVAKKFTSGSEEEMRRPRLCHAPASRQYPWSEYSSKSVRRDYAAVYQQARGVGLWQRVLCREVILCVVIALGIEQILPFFFDCEYSNAKFRDRTGESEREEMIPPAVIEKDYVLCHCLMLSFV